MVPRVASIGTVNWLISCHIEGLLLLIFLFRLVTPCGLCSLTSVSPWLNIGYWYSRLGLLVFRFMGTYQEYFRSTHSLWLRLFYWVWLFFRFYLLLSLDGVMSRCEGLWLLSVRAVLLSYDINLLRRCSVALSYCISSQCTFFRCISCFSGLGHQCFRGIKYYHYQTFLSVKLPLNQFLPFHVQVCFTTRTVLS